jgi:hypothetical protein
VGCGSIAGWEWRRTRIKPITFIGFVRARLALKCLVLGSAGGEIASRNPAPTVTLASPSQVKGKLALHRDGEPRQSLEGAVSAMCRDTLGLSLGDF